jgi:hypothetical protein
MNGDARASLYGGYWDIGYYEGQCADGESVVGVSKDAKGHLRGILCCTPS